MLQRAASNAYSWWWASHVRTKQSKWLEHNLQDMEEMVKYMLEIIDEDGDSFAKRAEMYYRRRPELISFVEEAYRAHRALAERYDHMSRELQNANRTIATVYPEQAQFAMDDEGEESPQVPKPAPSSDSNKAPPKALPAVPKAGLPQMPSLTRNYTKSFSRKGPLKRAVSTVEPSLRSGLSKGEALGEIDGLQKGILGLQTEKEFVKSAYETGLAKYWDIENKITEMQGRVCKLQDEFGIGTVIEDDEARSLMAATALRSCQDSLSRLQAEQEQSAEEAKEEFKKIKAAYEKLQTLKNEPLEEPEPEDGSSEEDKHELELLHYKEKVKEELEMSSTSSLNMTEMAEKIDDVVNKVIALETVVTTRAALMKRLRSESRELQSQIQTLEGGNESLVEDSDSVSDKLKELEEELNSVKKLNKNVEDQNRGLQIDFVRATCTLDHLKEKLQTVKPDEDVDDNGALFQVKIQERKESEGHEDAVEQEDNAPIPTTSETIKEEEEGNTAESIANTKSNLDVGSETSHDVVNGVEEAAQEMGEKLEEDAPNWRKLASNDFDEREKILLEEYSMILHDYREAKKKLGEVEKKKRDSLFELAMEIRELRNENALKDEEIQTLRQRLRTSDASKSDQSVDAKSTIEYQHWSPSPANQQQSLHELMSEHSFGSPMPILERTVTAMEEKLRSDIDSLLEENIDFWLRFSTSYHQITKFQTSIQDLRRDLLELNQSSTNTTKSNLQSWLKSDARPIYKHLREIQTELTLWLEQNALLKDELHTRLSSLCSIQEEIARASKGSSSDHQGAAFHEYQAAKFQGEVMNMKQENNKVAEELRSGFDRVRGLQLEMERMLKKMDSDFGFSVANQQQHNHHQQQQNQYQPMQRNRVPLRSFLFGVKLKKQHQKSSIFSCINPAALHKPYSSLGSGGFPP